MKKKLFIAISVLCIIGLCAFQTNKVINGTDAVTETVKYKVKCTVMQYPDNHVELIFDENVKYLGENYHQTVLADYNRHSFPSGLEAVGHLTSKWGWKQVGDGYVKDNKLCWDLYHEVDRGITNYHRDMEKVAKRFPDFKRKK